MGFCIRILEMEGTIVVIVKNPKNGGDHSGFLLYEQGKKRVWAYFVLNLNWLFN